MVFKMRTFSLPRTKEELVVIDGCPLKRFSFIELQLATNHFSNHNILGIGGFGKVYKGQLPDRSFIAVKRCKDDRTTGLEVQFHAEVEIGSSQASDHPNILRLLGYCMTRTERILVYPFMVNRDVYSRLHGRPESDPPLDWHTRKRIALGAAKAIAHLHYGSSFSFIHRDIKAANILLNDQFEAALGDFGLSKFISRNGNESNFIRVRRPMEEQDENEDPSEEDDQESDDQETCCFTKSCWNFTRAEDGGRTKWSCWAFTKNEVISESGHSTLENIGAAQPSYDAFNTHVITAVRGTMGHIAPEYLSTSKCTVKNDVFAYGIVLLELITGQKAFDLARLANDDDLMLLNWVKCCVGDGKLDLVVDSKMTGDYVKEEMKQLIQLALWCANNNLNKRPIMSEVTKIIENLGKPQFLSVEDDLSVKVCFDNVYPNVIQMLKDHPDATDPYEATLDADGCVMSTSDLASFVQCGSSIEIEPIQLQPEEVLPEVLPCASSQEIEQTRLQPGCESSHEIEQAQLHSEEVLFPENHTNCVKYESSQEIEQAKLQSEEVLFLEVLANSVKYESSQEIDQAQLQLIVFPEVLANCVQYESSQENEQIKTTTKNNQQEDFQLNITTSGIFLSFKFTKLSVLCLIILLASFSMNIVLLWPYAKPSY